MIYLQTARTLIAAHTGLLAAMAFNRDGTKLATASDKVKQCKFVYVLSDIIVVYNFGILV